jgi:hypothetical protein
LNTAGVGDITSALGSSNAKYSDADINAMATPLDGYSHVYAIKSPTCDYYLFVKTTDAYVDTSPSFGLTMANTQVGFGTSYAAVSAWGNMNIYGGHGIDQHSVQPGHESCCRYMFGIGVTDCWEGPAGVRCINGGIQCYGPAAGDSEHSNGQWPKLRDVQILLYGTDPAPSSDPGAAATGDPHLQNVYGERFDLMKPGKHVLIHIPKGHPVENAFFSRRGQGKSIGWAMRRHVLPGDQHHGAVGGG